MFNNRNSAAHLVYFLDCQLKRLVADIRGHGIDCGGTCWRKRKCYFVLLAWISGRNRPAYRPLCIICTLLRSFGPIGSKASFFHRSLWTCLTFSGKQLVSPSPTRKRLPSKSCHEVTVAGFWKEFRWMRIDDNAWVISNKYLRIANGVK